MAHQIFRAGVVAGLASVLAGCSMPKPYARDPLLRGTRTKATKVESARPPAPERDPLPPPIPPAKEEWVKAGWPLLPNRE